MGKYIDLHVHTSMSDGTSTPFEVVKQAADMNLAAIGITDHDTVNGVEASLEAGRILNVEVIPGVELSAEFEQELHILGYCIDVKSVQLKKTLKELREYRKMRNPKMIEKVNQLGMNITMEEVKAYAQGTFIGRPHIAAIMIQKGYVQNIEEAFEKYLAIGGAAYVPKKKLSPYQAITLIKQAEGVPVLAHPVFLEQKDIALEALVKQLISYGLMGIEAYYTEHSLQMRERYIALARKYHLLVTGGSDFHGKNKPDIMLGRGYGDLYVPYDAIAQLK